MKIISRFFQLLCFLIIFITTTSFASQQLIIEPDAGREPLLNAIQKAHSSIDVIMYGLTDSAFTHALIEAKKSGKHVKILLEPEPYRAKDENIAAIKHLKSENIAVQWPSKRFYLTHQKTFLIDQRYAIVLTFNLTHSTFKNQRNFGLIIDDPAMVKEIYAVYEADCQHNPAPIGHPDLIWSPDNAQDKILAFIRSAHSNIKVYAQDISDYQTVGALARAARTGVKVQVLTSKKPNGPSKKMAYLQKAGVDIRISRKYMIHAKVILIDDKKAIVGSINLTTPSLKKNRELAIITQDPNVIAPLRHTFDQDWEKAKLTESHHQHPHKQRSHNDLQHDLQQIEYWARVALKILKNS